MARWIERIQEYDFTIAYKKGEEVVSANALSRLYEGKNITEVDEDETMKKKIIREIHVRLLHRGQKSVEYELNKQYKWPKARK